MKKYYVICFILTLIVIMPVSVHYIMNGGIVCDWMVNVRDTAAMLNDGTFELYRDTEYITSSLYYIPSAIIYMLSNDIVLAYQLQMLFIQIGTCIGAWLFFHRIACGKNPEIITLMGVALYMLSPFRIYVCYDLADIPQAVVWMLIPFWGYTIIRLYEGKDQKDIYHKLLFMVLNALLFAAFCYIDSAFVLPVLLVSLAAALALRNVWIFLSDCLGAVAAMPALVRMLVYIAGGEIRIEYSASAMIEEGYYIGDIFSSFSYRTAHPGLGLGMLLCLSIYIWLAYVDGRRETGAKNPGLIAASLIFLILSLNIFPWDMLKGMDNFIGRISLYFYTPQIFMGMFYSCLCTLMVRGKFESEEENRNNNICFWIAAVILICMAVGSYMCENIFCDRYPLTKV